MAMAMAREAAAEWARAERERLKAAKREGLDDAHAFEAMLEEHRQELLESIPRQFSETDDEGEATPAR